jgi:hypothetical protein
MPTRAIGDNLLLQGRKYMATEGLLRRSCRKKLVALDIVNRAIIETCRHKLGVIGISDARWHQDAMLSQKLSMTSQPLLNRRGARFLKANMNNCGALHRLDCNQQEPH